MKAFYENDIARGAGYGLFRLEQVDAADANARYALVRSGDHKSLHPGGWEDTEYSLTPDSVSLDGGTVRLSVGPDVVNRLDQLNTYRLIYLSSSGAAEKAVLDLDRIIYAPVGGTNVVSAPAEPAPAPAQIPVQTPVQEAPIPSPGPAPEPVPPLEPLAARSPSPRKGMPAWKIALLTLLGFAFWIGVGWLVKNTLLAPDTAEKPVAEAPAEVPEVPAAPEEPATQPEASAPAQPAPEPPALLSPLDQARQFLRGNGSAAEALQLARSLPETPEGRDAAFLLAEAAADQGDAEAMMELAEFYNPLSLRPRGSIIADAEQAWIWYDKAAQAGKAEASNRRNALRVWLEDKAAKGSAEAADILRRLR